MGSPFLVMAALLIPAHDLISVLRKVNGDSAYGVIGCMKRCRYCDQEKALLEFPKRVASKDGRGYKCKACAVAYARLWRSQNREFHRASVREWQRANRERAAEASRRSRAKNKVRRAEICKAWNERNQDKRAAALARRRAKIFTPVWSDKNSILAFYKKAKELEKETGLKHHVDHIVPLNSAVVCGLHVEANLQILPATENVLKRNLFWPDMPGAD